MKLRHFPGFLPCGFGVVRRHKSTQEAATGDSAERVEMKSHMTVLAVAALAVATITATSAFAANPSQKGQSTQVSREQALRDCNGAVANMSESSWESARNAGYATCMTQHGQQP
jgi:hypothetical protein